MVGAEAAFITSGASAGMTLAAAVIMAKLETRNSKQIQMLEI